jgi:ParB family chromosome partitioning protein
MTKKRGLGRELSTLLNQLHYSTSPLTSVLQSDAFEEFRRLPIEYLHPSPFQPRKDIDQEALAELAESIKTQGIIQPIIVRKIDDVHYEIIAGERRWRAAQLANLDQVPALVKDISDHTALAVALIENIQREDLNPLEEANALQRLMKEFEMTQAETAQAVGKSRTAVTNILRLLKLNEQVRNLIGQRALDMGHARALLALNRDLQDEAAKTVALKGLSVRETENLVKRLLSPKVVRKSLALSPDVKHLQNSLSDRLNAKVSIQCNKQGKGKLIIQYNNLDELDGILKHIK